MSEHVVTMKFPDAESLYIFWCWWFDGGGDDGALDALLDCGREMTMVWDENTNTCVFKIVRKIT